jgi:release factor glutamine methyltransferase
MAETDARPTLGAVLAEGRRRLGAGGVDAPAREVAEIWATLFRRVAGESFLEQDSALGPDDAARLEAAFLRRARGEPLAHVTGVAGFRYLALSSDARALIPRPETEGLVQGVLARVRTGSALDVGTGTGCIALSLATEGAYSRVIGIDRSGEALALARANRAATGARVDFVRGDLLSSIAPASVDALVSNPPYLSTAEYGALDPGVRDWEPSAALVSGPDGLDATFELLDDGCRVVRPGGWIALELDCTRAARVAERAVVLGWTSVGVEADLFGRERYLFAQRSTTS